MSQLSKKQTLRRCTVERGVSGCQISREKALRYNFSVNFVTSNNVGEMITDYVR